MPRNGREKKLIYTFVSFGIKQEVTDLDKKKKTKQRKVFVEISLFLRYIRTYARNYCAIRVAQVSDEQLWRLFVCFRVGEARKRLFSCTQMGRGGGVLNQSVICRQMIYLSHSFQRFIKTFLVRVNCFKSNTWALCQSQNCNWTKFTKVSFQIVPDRHDRNSWQCAKLINIILYKDGDGS